MSGRVIGGSKGNFIAREEDGGDDEIRFYEDIKNYMPGTQNYMRITKTNNFFDEAQRN